MFDNGDDFYLGDFLVQVIDVCGSEVSKNFSIEVEDMVFFEVVCFLFIVDVFNLFGEVYLFDMVIIVFFSFDNCGVVFVIDFVLMEYGLDDVLDFIYFIIVLDQVGNFFFCFGIVQVNVIISVDQEEILVVVVDVFLNFMMDVFIICV